MRILKLCIILVLGLTSTLFYSCKKEYFSENCLHFQINGKNLEISLHEHKMFFNTETLNSEFTNTITLLNKIKGITVFVNGNKLTPNQPVEIKIKRIAYDENIEIKINDGTEDRIVYIRTLNSIIPTYTIVGTSPYKGDYYLTFLPIPIMLKLNQMGEIVYYQCAKDARYIAMTPESIMPMSYWDFKKHILPNGNVRYSYHEQDPNYNRLNMSGYAGGERVILDEKYKEIKRIKRVTNSGSSNNVVEGHDFYLIDDNHYITTNYEIKLVHNIPQHLNPHPQGSKVVAAHIQEIKNGSVLLNWYSTDYAELYALSENGNNDFANIKTQQPDYIHLNSVEIDNDGNLICSFRHISTILKIDRKSGDIIWKLSGDGDEFGLTDYQKTSNQHYARKTANGYLTIFDNNNKNYKTRILKLKINEATKTLTDWKEYVVPGRFSPACGSAINIENEVFVIGWGFSADEFSTLTEIDFASNQKLFELTFPKGMNITYRAVKY